MSTNHRRRLILEAVTRNGAVRVTDLSTELGVSAVTLRQDIRHLDSEGLVKRVYGGATSVDPEVTVRFEPGEYFLNAPAKAAIARRAMDYIDPGDSLILDDSSTANYLADEISRAPELKVSVVTNSILSAAILSSCPHVDLFVTGGHVIKHPPSSLDSIAVRTFGEYRVAKAFVGVDGINFDIGITSEGTPQMEVKRKIIEISSATYVIADSSKFGTRDLFTVCPLSDITTIITDDEIDDDDLLRATELDLHIDVVTP